MTSALSLTMAAAFCNQQLSALELSHVRITLLVTRASLLLVHEWGTIYCLMTGYQLSTIQTANENISVSD